MSRSHARTAVLLSLPALALAAALSIGATPRQTVPPPQRPAGQPGGMNFADRLLEGLRETEGCLGADAAQFQSRRLGIIAWFENKAAAKRWYYSETHAAMMRMAGGDPDEGEPMQHIEDEDVPVMVMATLGFDGPPAVPGSPIPFSSISIEMYTPLPGGAAVSERFAPDGFEIPHFRMLSE